MYKDILTNKTMPNVLEKVRIVVLMYEKDTNLLSNLLFILFILFLSVDLLKNSLSLFPFLEMVAKLS